MILHIIEKYHVNTPHEFYTTHSVVDGESDSFANNSSNKHLKYQHTRIIAVFGADQLPEFPQVQKDENITSMGFDED